jgi:hypothetical protein
VYSGEESPPGEFGVYQYVVPESLKEQVDAGLPEGPTSFTVAPNGDIYITDPLNKRIQRFDENGNFVSVIPIPPLERIKFVQESDFARVERLRRAGKLPKRDPQKPNDVQVVPKPKTINGYQWYWKTICVDQDNNVYLLWDEPNNISVRKYDQTGKLLSTYPLFEERGRERGGGTRLYCDSSGNLFFETYKRIKSNTYGLVTFQFGTMQQAFTPEQQKKTETSGSVRKKELGKVDLQVWEKQRGMFWGPEIWNYDFVDEKGNLYLYWSTKEGITITKWYKQ